MTEPRIIVKYADKKNSSGKVIDGVIHLSISARLTSEEREKHIQILTNKLQKKINWAKQYHFDRQGVITNDEELFRIAQTINSSYYQLPLQGAFFHKQYATWGTCSLKTRKIYLSHRLIGSSLDLLWYVVTHEICHLAEPGHNKRFWDLVKRACPHFRECRKKLKAYGLQEGVFRGTKNQEVEYSE